MKIKWLGQAAFQIKSDKTLVIDPQGVQNVSLSWKKQSMAAAAEMAAQAAAQAAAAPPAPNQPPGKPAGPGKPPTNEHPAPKAQEAPPV